MSDLHVSECRICNQVDDHPKHLFALPGDAESTRHMDCCAAVGCDVCANQIKGVTQLRGAELRDHLVTKG